GPVQCGPGSPCVDKSCCNSDGKCGFEKGHCHPDPPSTCISNCDAKAWCGKDSPNGKITCGLNVCCSKYGWCGWRPEHCGEDTDPKDPGSLCQKEFGRCGKVSPPSCGKDSGTATNGRKIAYYASWNTRNRECNRIWPHHINTEGLTHINFAFAGINPKSFVIQPMHPADPQLYLDFTALKTNGLETWIAVGGWDFSNPGSTHTTWSDMVSTKENRKAFIESAVDLMKTYGFQGIDLDWEYPVAEDRGGRPGDTKNQIALFVELREAIGNRFGFSSILAPDFWYLQHMDPFALSFQVDWFNYMAYDLHGTWDARIPAIGPRIAAHTNLHEIEEMLVSLWFNKLDPKKINFGMAHYGRGFTVKDKGCMHEGCEWADTNKPADCTNFPGIMSNTEIIQLIREKNLKPELLKGAEVKQITWDDQWMAYDDDETRAMKIEKANDLCMGGHFFWAIDYASGSGTGDDP
ncbi:glycoside hydrolase superfamily, partial [Dendryphion nanum]